MPKKKPLSLRPIAAARDATDIKGNGAPGSDSSTKSTADSLRREGVSWTRVAADDQKKNGDSPMVHAAFGPEWTARYGKGMIDSASSLDVLTKKNKRTLQQILGGEK